MKPNLPLPQSEKPLFSLNEISVKRNGRWLVERISLEVSQGEIVTLIGPNGSGKTTTVRVALGLIKPTMGTVWRNPKVRTSYVPQRFSIDSNLPLSVRRFITLTQKLDDDAIGAALTRVGIAHLIDSPIQALSGGEFQRAQLARAIATKPDLLVLDEPVQGVDVTGEIALYELIASIRDELNCAILLISHDLHLVMAATDRVICLNGHICCQGTASAVADDPIYQDLFGQRGANALALYSHHHDHSHGPDGSLCTHDHTNE